MRNLILSGILCLFWESGLAAVSSAVIWETTGGEQERSLKTLSVVDTQGIAIAGAQVLLGYAVDDPFMGNFLVTDSSGAFMPPESWTQALPITISAPGYIRATYFDQLPNAQIFQLNRIDQHQRIEVKGKTSGYGSLEKDGFANFSVLLPAFDRTSLMNFDLSQFISPENDVVKVIGNEVNIPSNVALPKQKENYVIPVTLEKPQYRVYLQRPGEYFISALHGKFPFKKVVDKVRDGGSMLEAINDFDLFEGSVVPVSARNPTNQKDIAVNQMRFDARVQVTAPSYANGLIMLSAVTFEHQGKLVPSDVKTVAALSSQSLKVPSKKALQQLAVLRKNTTNLVQASDLQELTAVISQDAQFFPEFLPLIAAPQFDGLVLKMRVPAPLKALRSFATYAVMSDVKIAQSEVGVHYEEKTRSWEFYADDWTSQIRIPTWPEAIAQANTMRWEVLFLAAHKDEFTQLGPQILAEASHVTRNASDY